MVKLVAGVVLAIATGLSRPASQPVHVTGRVLAQGCGVAGVGLTDGVALVTTGADGSFALDTETARGFVRVVGPNGERLRFTARERLRAGSMHVRFFLVP